MNEVLCSARLDAGRSIRPRILLHDHVVAVRCTALLDFVVDSTRGVLIGHGSKQQEQAMQVPWRSTAIQTRLRGVHVPRPRALRGSGYLFIITTSSQGLYIVVFEILVASLVFAV